MRSLGFRALAGWPALRYHAPPMQTRSAWLETLGCQMNEADSRRMAQQLEFVGFEPTESPESADVVVLNTCVVRQQAENKAVGKLGAIQAIKAERQKIAQGREETSKADL